MIIAGPLAGPPGRARAPAAGSLGGLRLPVVVAWYHWHVVSVIRTTRILRVTVTQIDNFTLLAHLRNRICWINHIVTTSVAGLPPAGSLSLYGAVRRSHGRPTEAGAAARPPAADGIHCVFLTSHSFFQIPAYKFLLAVLSPRF